VGNRKGYRGFESKRAYEEHYSDPANYASEIPAMKAYAEESERERAAQEADRSDEKLEVRLAAIADSLPDGSIREVALIRLASGEWRVLAGGHYAVSLGEWEGDFSSEYRPTIEQALAECESKIKGE
jgi:hypothetical protein